MIEKNQIGENETSRIENAMATLRKYDHIGGYSCKACGNPFNAHPPDDVHKFSSVYQCWKFDWIEREYRCPSCSKTTTLYWHSDVHKYHDYATVEAVTSKMSNEKYILSTSTHQQTEEKNINIARRSFEALNTGDVTKVSEFIHPNYFNHESQASPERAKLRGPEEFVDTVKKLRAAFSDLHYEEQESITSNDKVVSIVIVTGKHTGDFFGIPPMGNSFSYQATHISRIADDKIVEHKAIRDDLRFMMQLGVIGAASQQYEPIINAWKGMMMNKRT